MNYEEAKAFADNQRLSEAEQEVLKAKAEAEKLSQAKDFIKTRRIFKELLPNKEAVEKFKECRDYLVLNVLPKVIGNAELFDAKFYRGYVDGLDTIVQVVDTYDKYIENYGDKV